MGTEEAGLWPIAHKTMSAVKTGEIQGATSATQLPDVKCQMVRFKAASTNTGNVYLGVAGVTLPDGTTDATTGFALHPYDDTGWIPVDNLNRFYVICDNSIDDLTYIALINT